MIHNRSGPPVEQKYQEVLANPCGICESPRAQINNKKPQPKTEANSQLMENFKCKPPNELIEVASFLGGSV